MINIIFIWWLVNLFINHPVTAPTVQQSINISVSGGVVPHYELVDYQINAFWQELSKRYPNDNKPQRIILVGPDHTNQGIASFTTINQADVLGTTQKLDDAYIQWLIETNWAQKDPEVFKQEYSLRIQLPYIQRYFPAVSIVPILLRSDITEQDINSRLTAMRAQCGTIQTLVVASVDFSHFLDKNIAKQHDQISLQALQQFDYHQLIQLDAGYFDSAAAILLTSGLVCPDKQCRWEVLAHGNSADLPNSDARFTTSYFALILNSNLR